MWIVSSAGHSAVLSMILTRSLGSQYEGVGFSALSALVVFAAIYGKKASLREVIALAGSACLFHLGSALLVGLSRFLHTVLGHP